MTLKNSADSGGAGKVMQFKVTSKAADDSSVPATLSTIEKLTVDGAKRRLVFALDGDQWHDERPGLRPGARCSGPSSARPRSGR